jgi:2-aminoadipate transaminase
MSILDNVPRARRARFAVPSAVREILKVTERPDVISFAGGLPAEELFPVEAMQRAIAETLSRDGRAALQYGTTEGYPGLRAWIAERLARHGRPVHAEDLIVTHGSQQGLDLVARVLLDPGDKVVIESPSYLAAIQVFRAAEARMITVPLDQDGIDVGALERVLETEHPKLLYLNPDHQNPSGARLQMARRIAVLELCRRHGVAIIEDDPYGEICFDGPRHPPLYALDGDGAVVYLGTFSKTLAPGLRLGWVVASPGFLRSVAIAKQGNDLHTATLNQRATARLLETFDYDAHLGRIRAVYQSRAKAMESALRDQLGDSVEWISPSGGLFLWVGLPHEVSIDRLFERALSAKVAFVTGEPFFADPTRAPRPYMRLNFSHRPEPVIAEGIKRLAAAVREEHGRVFTPAIARRVLDVSTGL